MGRGRKQDWAGGEVGLQSKEDLGRSRRALGGWDIPSWGVGARPLYRPRQPIIGCGLPGGGGDMTLNEGLSEAQAVSRAG